MRYLLAMCLAASLLLAAGPARPATPNCNRCAVDMSGAGVVQLQRGVDEAQSRRLSKGQYLISFERPIGGCFFSVTNLVAFGYGKYEAIVSVRKIDGFSIGVNIIDTGTHHFTDSSFSVFVNC